MARQFGSDSKHAYYPSANGSGAVGLRMIFLGNEEELLDWVG